MTRPTLETERLLLRPFRLDDATEVQRLFKPREIAAATLAISHPYPEGAAEAWIGRHAGAYERGESVDFAIEVRAERALVGAIGMVLERAHRRAELGYWIGLPYWGRGYATEAGRAVVDYAFSIHGLNPVFAFHWTTNPASGRVLEKVGMTYEGTRRKHSLKWGEFLDSKAYGILRDEWLSRAC